MNIKTQSKNKEKGTAMALALLFSVILLGVGLALVYLTYLEEITSNFAVQGSQAFYPADVETAYVTIGRTIVSQYGNWNDLLGLNAPDSNQFCTAVNPPACSNEIAQNFNELQQTQCKGRILRRPPPPAQQIDLSNAAGNPFNLQCDSAEMFCNCQLVIPTGSGSRRLPQRVTLYIRNDPGDMQVLQDQNGEVQLIAVSRMPSILVEGATASSIIAYDLTAWSQTGKVYDIHQTGSFQTQ